MGSFARLSARKLRHQTEVEVLGYVVCVAGFFRPRWLEAHRDCGIHLWRVRSSDAPVGFDRKHNYRLALAIPHRA